LQQYRSQGIKKAGKAEKTELCLGGRGCSTLFLLGTLGLLDKELHYIIDAVARTLVVTFASVVFVSEIATV